MMAADSSTGNFSDAHWECPLSKKYKCKLLSYTSIMQHWWIHHANKETEEPPYFTCGVICNTPDCNKYFFTQRDWWKHLKKSKSCDGIAVGISGQNKLPIWAVTRERMQKK